MFLSKSVLFLGFFYRFQVVYPPDKSHSYEVQKNGVSASSFKDPTESLSGRHRQQEIGFTVVAFICTTQEREVYSTENLVSRAS